MAKPKSDRLKISDIYLDSKNPRHIDIDNEAEIIDHLVKKEKILSLAKEIAEHGTSPLEIMAVIPHPELRGKFIVQEGNRRLCSLKLLRDPARAPNSRSKAAFERLKEGARISPEVNVVIFPDRKSARYWLRLRHLGGQGGAGVKNWDVRQKARFDAEDSSVNPNSLAVEMVEYAVKAGLIDEAEMNRLKVTTLSRYLSNAVVRDALGITNRHSLQISAPAEQFDVAVSTFLKDAAIEKDPPVHSRSDRAQREAYAASLRSRGVAVKDRIEKPVVPSAAASKTRQRNNPSPDLRAHVVPASVKLHLESKTLKRVFDELRRIDPDFSFAAAYLLRAFLEQLLRDYAVVNGLGHGEVHAIAGRCAKHLLDQKSLAAEHGERKLEAMLKPLRLMANEKESRLSPDSMGAWVHGNVIPTSAELNRRWDTLEPSILLLVNGLKK